MQAPDIDYNDIVLHSDKGASVVKALKVYLLRVPKPFRRMMRAICNKS